MAINRGVRTADDDGRCVRSAWAGYAEGSEVARATVVATVDHVSGLSVLVPRAASTQSLHLSATLITINDYHNNDSTEYIIVGFSIFPVAIPFHVPTPTTDQQPLYFTVDRSPQYCRQVYIVIYIYTTCDCFT